MYTTSDGALHIPTRFGKFWRYPNMPELATDEIVLEAGTFDLLLALGAKAGVDIYLRNVDRSAPRGSVTVAIYIHADGTIEYVKNTATVMMN